MNLARDYNHNSITSNGIIAKLSNYDVFYILKIRKY